MNNACPHAGCDAVYNLNPQHVGKQFACRKCGALLFVDTGGLREAEAEALHLPDPQTEPVTIAPAPPQPDGPAPVRPATPLDAPPAPRSPRRPEQMMAGIRGIGSRVMQDLPSWLLGLGALLVIVCLFCPMLDRTKAARMKSRIDARDVEEARAEQAVVARETAARTDAAIRKAVEDERKARNASKEAWAKEKPELEQAAATAAIHAKSYVYWYTWGMMIGFLLLAMASVGYLTSAQTTRRVVGAILLCGQLLLIFLVYVLGSFGTVMDAAK